MIKHQWNTKVYLQCYSEFNYLRRVIQMKIHFHRMTRHYKCHQVHIGTVACRVTILAMHMPDRL